jgi:hypothetical protein
MSKSCDNDDCGGGLITNDNPQLNQKFEIKKNVPSVLGRRNTVEEK